MSIIQFRNFACLALIAVAGCGSGGSGDEDDLRDPSCPLAPAGLSTAPTSILAAVEMANTLLAQPADPPLPSLSPSPSLSLPCFVQSLSRPLTVLNVQSVFSLQPAVGERNPRIFIFSGPLVMSVAPAGPGHDLLELAEYPSPLRSIKAEMAFPLTAPLAPSEPFRRIHNSTDTGTTCGNCHGGEELSTRLTFAKAYESVVFKPRPRDVVPMPYMREQARTCDPQQEPYRCALLKALFQRGDVLTGAFATEAPTIYD